MGKIESSTIRSSSSSVVLMGKNDDEDEYHKNISSSVIKTDKVSSNTVDTSVSSSIDAICAKTTEFQERTGRTIRRRR
jgi:hypothetical protein